MLIVADDLTGAADCAVQGVRNGLSGFVAMSAEAMGAAADLVAVDADSRSLPEADAARRVAALVQAAAPGRRLFKKVDSTLRGHVAAELAAALASWRASHGGQGTALFAPAFPAAGRVLIDGRLLLHGAPLEQSELWQREGGGQPACLPAMFRQAGLASAGVPLATVRADHLPDRLRQLAAQADVLVCDAELDADLAALAHATRQLGDAVLFAGSAGLAGHLAAAAGRRSRFAAPEGLPVAGRPLLFVVGSMSSVSLRQATVLEAAGARPLLVPLAELVDADDMILGHWRRQLAAALAKGTDVVLRPVPGETADRQHALPLRRALAAIVAGSGDQIGGLFVTGGETARAVLDGLGVAGLWLHREVEPGIPLAVATGRHRFGVITKAGAFGDDRTMLSCRQALSDLRQRPAPATATCETDCPS